MKIKKDDSICSNLINLHDFKIKKINFENDIELKSKKYIYYDGKNKDIYIILDSSFINIIDNEFNIQNILLSNIYIEHEYLSNDNQFKIFYFSNSRSTLIFNSVLYNNLQYNIHNIYIPISYIKIKNKDVDSTTRNLRFDLIEEESLTNIISVMHLDKSKTNELKSYLSQKEILSLTNNFDLINILCVKRKNILDVNLRFKINKFIVETIKNTII
jgi:hypothetical protein